jgi:formylmethanofuran dehydrogenase subunit E
MKFYDYGKMAATFLNTMKDIAVRVVAKEEARQKAKDYFPEIEDKYIAQLEAYKIMPDEELFEIMDVRINIPPEDLPGRPLSRVRCDLCGEFVQDMREIKTAGVVYCKACADGGISSCYFAF